MVNLKSIEKEVARQTRRQTKALKLCQRLQAVGALDAWLTLSCRFADADDVIHKVTEPGNKFEIKPGRVRYWSPFALVWFVWTSQGANQFYCEAEEKSS